MIHKTKCLIVSVIKSVVKERRFGDSGFLGLSAKMQVYGNEFLAVEDCKAFDKTFSTLFKNLIQIEIDILKLKDGGTARKKIRNIKQGTIYLGSLNRTAPKERALEIVKDFMSNRETSKYSSKSSPKKHLSFQQVPKNEKSDHLLFKPFLLDSLFERKVGFLHKDLIIKKFIEANGKQYAGAFEAFNEQLAMMIGVYSNSFNKIISLIF